MNVREAAKTRNRLTTWYVESETTPGTEYIVHNKRDQVSHRKIWTCNCPDFNQRRVFRREICKHIVEVQNKIAVVSALANAAPITPVGLISLKPLLDQLVQLLNAFGSPDGSSLWDILTALRGPDDGDDSVKAGTTAKVRYILGLRSGNNYIVSSDPLHNDILAALRQSVPFSNNKYNLKTAVRGLFPKAQDHFVSHFVNALLTLKSLGYIK